METPLISKRKFNKIHSILPGRKHKKPLDDRSVFNGWERLSDNCIEMKCKGSGQTEEEWLKSLVFPQVQYLFRKLEPTGMILLAIRFPFR